MNFIRKKLHATKISIKKNYNLYASAYIVEKDREGSHLCHFTRGTYIDMGRLLQKILKEDKFTSSTLANYNFLDIGGGLGKAVIHFRSFHMSKCVCIESSSNASMIWLKRTRSEFLLFLF